MNIQSSDILRLAVLSALACSLAACKRSNPTPPPNNSNPPAASQPADKPVTPPAASQPVEQPITPPPVTPPTPNPTPPAVSDNDMCAPILAKNNALKGGREISSVTPLSRPARGVAVEEPDYGTCLAVASDNDRRVAYSRRQAFNADDSRFLAHPISGPTYWFMYDTKTGSQIKRLPVIEGAATEPVWHPSDPNILYFMHEIGLGLKIYQMNVESGEVSTAADMGDAVRKLFPQANIASTRAEGSPSEDGRYWCLMARAEAQNYRTLGVFTWDMREQRIIGHMDLDPSIAPDHVSTSPSGKYCVISSDTPGWGTRAYHSDFRTTPYNRSISTPYLELLSKSEHSDLAYTRDKHDAYIAVDYSGAGDGNIFFTDLETGKRTNLFSVYGHVGSGASTAVHLSGRAFAKPGWVLMSTYADSGSNQWLFKKVFAFSLEENSQIRYLANTRTTTRGYWGEPHGTVNRDFTRVLYNSNWGGPDSEMAVNLIGIPANALD